MGDQKTLDQKAVRTLPGIISMGKRLGTMPAAPAVGVGALSMFGGLLGMHDAYTDAEENGWNTGNGFDMARGGGSFFSGLMGTTGQAASAIGAETLGASVGTSFFGTLGAVIGAGLMGYGTGTVMEEAASSSYADNPMAGLDPWGRPRSFYDKSIDDGVAINDWIDEATDSDMLGDVVGGGYALGGAVWNAPGSAMDAAGGFAAECASDAWNAIFD